MAEDFTSYEQALDWLFNDLPLADKDIYRGKRGFEDSRLLLEKLGNPQNKKPTIHVAGTSGKGSVAWIASRLLVDRNYSVGTLMSPHVYDFRERFLVDCDFVATSEVLDAINSLRKVLTELWKQDCYPTFFQAVVALGYQVFENHDVDYYVIEVGVGGLLDATNHISGEKIAVVTTIGRDHTEILGESLSEITDQKAGIITPKSKVVYLDQANEVNESILSRPNSGVVVVSPTGEYQNDNTLLAIRAVETLLGESVEQQTSLLASKSEIPGRYEVRESEKRVVLLDGAHNEQKLRALTARIKHDYPGRKFLVVLAMGSKKEVSSALATLEGITESFLLTKYVTLANVPGKSALDFSAHDLKGLKVPHKIENDRSKLMQILGNYEGDILVTGSFYLVGELGSSLP